MTNVAALYRWKWDRWQSTGRQNHGILELVHRTAAEIISPTIDSGIRLRCEENMENMQVVKTSVFASFRLIYEVWLKKGRQVLIGLFVRDLLFGLSRSNWTKESLNLRGGAILIKRRVKRMEIEERELGEEWGRDSPFWNAKIRHRKGKGKGSEKKGKSEKGCYTHPCYSRPLLATVLIGVIKVQLKKNKN